VLARRFRVHSTTAPEDPRSMLLGMCRWMARALVLLGACSPFGGMSEPPAEVEDAAVPANEPPLPPSPPTGGEDAAAPAADCPVDGALYCETFTTRADLGSLDGLSGARGGAAAELVGALNAPERALRVTTSPVSEFQSISLTAQLGKVHEGPVRVSFRLTQDTAPWANLVFLGFTAPDEGWETTYYVYAWTEEGRLGLGQYMYAGPDGEILTFKRTPESGALELGRQYRVSFTVDRAQRQVSATLDGVPVLTLALTPPGERTSMWVSTGVQTRPEWPGPPADITYDDITVEAL
jgi:hypothetical protein